MSLSVKIKLTGQSAFTDFTSFVYAGGGNETSLMTKKHALNSLPTLTFVLKEASGFLSPDLHNEVQVDCATYSPSGQFFTGFIAEPPSKAFFAQESDGTVRVLWTINCASEVFLCDQRAPLYFGNIVPFQNQTVGQIVKYLLGLLAPGRFDVTNVDDGPTIPLYAPLSTDLFMTVIKNLAEPAGMKFWTRRGLAYLKYFNDGDMGIALNQADATFNPDDITISPIASPILNDVLGYGDEEPGVYVREYFAADGLSTQFGLHLPVAGLLKETVLQDDFTGTGVDLSKWTRTDPTNVIQQGPSLYVASGAGLNSTKLVAVQSLELAGTTLVQHGIVRFTAASSGIIGGLYSAGPSTHFLSSCMLGFEVRTSGGVNVAGPVVSGAVVQNLLTWSEQLDHAPWAPGGTATPTVTPNVSSAPDGTLTADKIVFPSTSAGQEGFLGQDTGLVPSAGVPQTFSAWLRADSNLTIALRFVQSGGANDVQGSVNVTTGWVRYSFTHNFPTVSATGGNLLARFQQGASQASKTCFVWGAQVNRGANPAPYISTTASSFDYSLPLSSGIDYIFQTYFQAPQRVRQLRTFGSLDTPSGFSSVAPTSSIYFALRLLGLSEADYSAVPTAYELYNGTIPSAPAFASYAPFNSDNLNVAVNFLSVSHPPDVIAMRYPSAAVGQAAVFISKLVTQQAQAQPQTYTIGDSKEVDKDATILAGQSGQSPATFSLFGIVAPSAGDVIEVRYRSAAQMAARITNPSSIALEASRMGDDGHRAAVLPQLGFAPRNSAELELAIKAYLDDHDSTIYQGEWSYDTFRQGASAVAIPEPIPGRFFTVNVSSQYPQFSAFCNEVDADIMVESTSPSGAEVIHFKVKFGNLMRFDSLVGQLGLQDRNAPESVGLQGSFDTTLPASTDFNAVGTSYAFAPDVPDFRFTYSKTPSTYQVDFGTTPPTSPGGDVGHFEVRYSDASWGIPSSLNLIAETSGGLVSLGRTSRTQQYFAKAVVPVNLATHSGFEDGVNYFVNVGSQVITGAWVPSGVGDNASIRLSLPAGFSSPPSGIGYFSNTQLTGLLSGATTLAGRMKARFSRALSGTERIDFTIDGSNGLSVSPATSSNITSGLFSSWQEFVFNPVGFHTSGLHTEQIYVEGNGALVAPLTVWVDDVQIEKNPGVSASPYFRTTVLPKGPTSRYASLAQVNFPLVPPAPTGIIFDGTKTLKPSMTTPLPSGPFTDVFGLHVADGATGVYDYNEPGGSLGITFNDPGLVFVYDNSVLKARSKSFSFNFYNSLGEYSPSTVFAMSIPTAAVTGVALDEVGQAITWGTNPTAVQYEAQVSTSANFSVLVASGTAFATTLKIPVDSVVNQRFFRVRLDDGLGFGGFTSGSHVYSPCGAISFDNTNNVKSVGFPPTPTSNPVYPGPFQPIRPILEAQAWDDSTREIGRFSRL